MTTKEKKQKQALANVIRQSFAYQKRENEEKNQNTIENLMRWNRENLSPTGGKKAFLKTQKEMMTKKSSSGWITKRDEQ